MEENNQPQISITKVILVAIIILLVGVIGYLTLFLIPQKFSVPEVKKATDSNDQVEAEIEDDREVLALVPGKGYYGQGVEEKFNTDESNVTIIYSNQDKGISLELPYNQDWGNEEYKINPYDEFEDVVRFGHVSPFEGGYWSRTYYLKYLPPKSADQVIQELKNKYELSELIQVYGAIKINDLKVVKYLENGLCGYPTLQIIGNQYNYELQPRCGGPEDFDVLEKIVETVELFEAATSYELKLKTFRNEVFGISFFYPEDYELTYNGVYPTSSAKPQKNSWYRVHLEKFINDQNVLFVFEINADGYGPFFSDKHYNISPGSNNNLSLDSIEVYEPNEFNTNRRILLIPDFLKSVEGTRYSWRFSFDEGDKDFEQEFKDILLSFKFDEPLQYFGWGEYENEEFGLSIKTPPGFKLVGEARGLTISKYTSLIRLAFGQEKNFGPGYDGEFFIFVFDREEGIKENIIFGTGAQFSDRKEEQKAVEVSGVIAYKFTILTEQRENWIMESVFVESNDKLFWIHNGAIPHSAFESFYESFKFIE